MGSQPLAAGAVPASLREARAAIPSRCYEPSDRRGWWAVAKAVALYLAPVLALAWVEVWWALPPLWLLAGLGVAGLFVLGHDASHGTLFRSASANRWAGRLCMVPSAHVEAAWDLGHNRIHHGYTARQGFDFVWHPSTVDDYRDLGWLHRVRHRLEWSWVGAGPYYLRTVWWSKMIRFPGTERRRTDIRHDKLRLAAAVVALVAATATAGAVSGGLLAALWMPVKTLIVPFLVFVHIIGWTVYVHHVSPEMRWWSRREWTKVRGQLESTTILRMPSVMNRLWLHNIFVHVPHHLDARIPFHQLPTAAEALLATYPTTVRQRRFRLRDYFHAARTCKLYDFDKGAWLPYPRRRDRAQRHDAKTRSSSSLQPSSLNCVR